MALYVIVVYGENSHKWQIEKSFLALESFWNFILQLDASREVQRVGISWLGHCATTRNRRRKMCIRMLAQRSRKIMPHRRDSVSWHYTILNCLSCDHKAQSERIANANVKTMFD